MDFHTEILSNVPQYGTLTHANSEIRWTVFYGNILEQQKNGFLSQPEPMRTLSRVPLEHSWDGHKGWDYEVGLGSEADATRGLVNFS